MGERIGYEFRRLLEEGKIRKIKPSKEMIQKELDSAVSDLKASHESFERHDFKWATIQGYYSMFHGVKALILDKGFREKGHRALLVALREFFGDKLGSLIDSFEQAMELREEADYGLKFSEVGALETVEGAEKLLAKVKQLLK